MRPETHEYLRAHRPPGHTPGEFVDSLPDIEGTLEEVTARAYEEGRQRLQEKHNADPPRARAADRQ